MDAVVEGVTGISFPTRIKTSLGSFGSSDEARHPISARHPHPHSIPKDATNLSRLQVLVGTAVRCMMGMCQWQRARAYAVGLYVQEPLAEKFSGSEERKRAPEDNGAAARELLLGGAAPGSRRLVLVMNQDGAGADTETGNPPTLLVSSRAEALSIACHGFLLCVVPCCVAFSRLPALPPCASSELSSAQRSAPGGRHDSSCVEPSARLVLRRTVSARTHGRRREG